LQHLRRRYIDTAPLRTRWEAFPPLLDARGDVALNTPFERCAITRIDELLVLTAGNARQPASKIDAPDSSVPFRFDQRPQCGTFEIEHADPPRRPAVSLLRRWEP
jgi:hypothetical protein